MTDFSTLIGNDVFAQIVFLMMLGGVSGLLAGLLGIGGGIILVPGLFFLFRSVGYDPALWMHMAVGTSLAVIIPAGFSSARAHHKRGAVRFDLVRRIGGGIVAGVIIGTAIAASVDGRMLLMVFAAALALFAVLMQFPPRKKAGTAETGNQDGAQGAAQAQIHQQEKQQEQQEQGGPRKPYDMIGGFGIGVLSTLMGIGGASLNVPFMTLNGVPIHKAVGSAAAMGPLIALPGALGFAVIGWTHMQGVEGSLGYIHLLSLIVIAPVAALMAPQGARIAHSLNVVWLRRVFAGFLIIVAVRMMVEALEAGGSM